MDIKKLKADFPIFKTLHQGRELIYFDSGSTSQKPQLVVDALTNFYTHSCANIHRAVHDLGEQATAQYNLARQTVAKFMHAQPHETIFTPGTTAGINFIAATWGAKFIKAGDEIIVSISEHHANFVPWQQLAQKTGAVLKIINLTPDYQLDLAQYQELLSAKTKLVAITYSSNVLGVINNLDLIIASAKKFGAAVLVDAAQAVTYNPIDVQQLDCDFLVFSSHKMFGPDGLGVLFIKDIWHDQISPYQFGGGMVASVDLNQTKFLKAPAKFEAGTMSIASAIGLMAAINYYQTNLPYAQLQSHLASLCARLIAGLLNISQIKIVGNTDLLIKHGHLVSFTVSGFHAHDVAAYLNQFGICVRAGHHCAQPLHDYLKISATVRVSFQIYNSVEDVDYLLLCLHKLIEHGF